MTKCDFEAGHKPIDKIGLLAKEGITRMRGGDPSYRYENSSQ